MKCVQKSKSQDSSFILDLTLDTCWTINRTLHWIKNIRKFLEDTITWSHWYPCFVLGFKARVDDPSLACFIACAQWNPQIHLWCNTCWPLGSQDASRAILIHILANKHWWGCGPGSIMHAAASVWEQADAPRTELCQLGFYGLLLKKIRFIQWRIYIVKFWTRAPSGSKFFEFHAVFGKIWQNHVGVPPAPPPHPKGWRPHLGEILDPPLPSLIFWETASFWCRCLSRSTKSSAVADPEAGWEEAKKMSLCILSIYTNMNKL